MAVSNTTITHTVTFTSTHTSIQQLAATPFLGIPTELWIVIFGVIAFLGYTAFKLQVKTTPVNLLLLRRNYSGLLLRVSEDINGIFLKVFQGNKQVETLKKVGRAIEVTIPGGDAKLYIEEKKRNGFGLQKEVIDDLKSKGFKVEEEQRRKNHNGYLLTKSGGDEKVNAYLDMPRGGVKTMRLYTGVEGINETVDYPQMVRDAKPQDATGISGVLNEEISTVKTLLHEWAKAMQGTFRDLIVPALLGGGMTGMVILLIMILSGFHR